MAVRFFILLINILILFGVLAASSAYAATQEEPYSNNPGNLDAHHPIFGLEYLSEPSNKPILWEIDIYTDMVSNMAGGRSKGTAADFAVMPGISIDTEKMHWWKGGTFTIGVLGAYSGLPSPRYVGDFQGVSSIELFDAHSKVWSYYVNYRQQFNENFDFIGGIIDFNSHFLTTESSDTLLNSGFGIIPSVQENVDISDYPDTGLGGILGYQTKDWGLKGGIYQGNPDHPSTAFYRGYFGILETNLHYIKGNNEGILMLGVWGYNQPAYKPPRFTSSTVEHFNLVIHNIEETSSLKPSNWGVYSTIQEGWILKGGSKLETFLLFGATIREISEVPYSLGLGLKLTGPFKNRPDDAFTVGATRAWFKDALPETANEIGYNIKLNKHLYIQPDLQYVIHPSGIFPNAWVALLNVSIYFNG